MNWDKLEQELGDLFRQSSPGWRVRVEINDLGNLQATAEHPLSHGLGFDSLDPDTAVERVRTSMIFKNETANIEAAPAEVPHQDLVMRLRVGLDGMPAEAVRFVTAILWEESLLTREERDWIRQIRPVF